MDPNQDPSRASTASASASTSHAPFKLTFRLGGGSTGNTSSVSTSAPSVSSNPTPMSSTTSSSPRPVPVAGTSSSFSTPSAAGAPPPGPGSASALQSSRLPPTVASSSRAGSVSATSASGDTPIKRKRKAAVKRAPGEVGPGKHWRKGLRGTIVAGQPLPPRPAQPSNAPSPDPSVPNEPSLRTSFPLAPSIPGGAVKASAPFLPALPLEPKTPASRRWTRGLLAIKTIRGSVLKMTGWEGDQNSDYAAWKLARNPPIVADASAGPSSAGVGTGPAGSSASPSVGPSSPAMAPMASSPGIGVGSESEIGVNSHSVASTEVASRGFGRAVRPKQEDGMGDITMSLL